MPYPPSTPIHERHPLNAEWLLALVANGLLANPKNDNPNPGQLAAQAAEITKALLAVRETTWPRDPTR